VEGRVREVSEVIERAEDLPRWWPSVYIEPSFELTAGERNEIKHTKAKRGNSSLLLFTGDKFSFELW
jgi:hypothetical protein